MSAAKRDSFGSSFAVIMAYAGSAIGLGNLWRFPYLAGENGGAAFIFIYLICTLLLSLPIFLAEAVIGRHAQLNAVGSMKKLAPKSFWNILGVLSVLTPTVLLSYYSIVGGWSVEYFLRSFNLNYGEFLPSGYKALAFGTVMLGITCLVVACGVKNGIEKFSKYSIPALFLFIIIIMVYALRLPGATKGVEYLIHPDFSKITGRTIVAAIGQSFYSMSLGSGIILTYSSYVSKKENMMTSGVWTAISSIIFAIIAGFAIMPAVFAKGIDPESGPGLLFVTLPEIFVQMGQASPFLGRAISVLFFLTVVVAALTSTISLVEPGIAWLVEEKRIPRRKACIIMFAVIWLFGVGSAFSQEIFGFVDNLCSNILLIFGALIAVLFVGWKMDKTAVRDELTNKGSCNTGIYKLVYFAIRYLAPATLIVVFIFNFI